jgi:hypothetical protein
MALFLILINGYHESALHRANAYTYFMSDEDREMLKWLKIFK